MPRDLFAEAGITPQPGAPLDQSGADALVAGTQDIGKAPPASGARDLFAEAGINPQASLAKPGMPSMFPSIAYGARQPLDAAAQLLAKGTEAVFPSAADTPFGVAATQKPVAEAEAAYKTNPSLTSTGMDTAGRAIGNAAATLPIGYLMPGAGAASLMGRMASGAAAGGLSNALQPNDPNSPDFWKQKAMQAGQGAAFGAAAPAITAGIARVISPKTSDAVKTLLDAGITPTPGQMLGGMANSLEEKAGSLPGIGESIKAARGRAVQQMNRAAIDNALAPIGEKSAAPLGREAIDEAATKISQAFDRTVPNLTSRIDPQFARDMSQLTSMSQSMVPQRAQQFAGIINNQVLRKISPNGTITGESAHEMQSTLGRLAAMAHKSPDMDQRLLGDALQQAQSNVIDLIGRSNPTGAEAFNAARSAYKNFIPVRQAASYLGSEEGILSPAQLLSGVKSADRSLNHAAFARGKASGQGFAEAAKTVLGNKVPDSGTAGRNALWEIPATLAGLYALHPGAAMGAAAGGAGTMLAYTPQGQALMRGLLTARPVGAEGLAQGLRLLGPGASTLAPLLAASPPGQ